jgi:hypothetical protein
MATSLRKRFGIGDIVIVADRGVVGKRNAEELEKLGFSYILGVRMRLERKAMAEVLSRAGRFWEVSDNLKVYETLTTEIGRAEKKVKQAYRSSPRRGSIPPYRQRVPSLPRDAPSLHRMDETGFSDLRILSNQSTSGRCRCVFHKHLFSLIFRPR